MIGIADTTKRSMRIAVTGATGFLGRYLLRELVAAGHRCRCWARKKSGRRAANLEDPAVEWIEGDLNDAESHPRLIRGCDAVVHAALYRTGPSFRGGEGDLLRFVETNFLGTLRLMEAARNLNHCRFVFISTCAVHEQILDDRPLDENHPTTPRTHYGAHKAALEQFVQSFGGGEGDAICALRPTGIYGLAEPPENSKWFSLIEKVALGKPVTCQHGGKEVHAADVAKAVALLLAAPEINGQIYNCYDRYISEYDVAQITAELTGSQSPITGEAKQPRHVIETKKIEGLGMQFGGEALLRNTVGQILACISPKQASE